MWQALGGDPPKRGRARAFWRDGDGLNVSLSDDKGAWYDFRDNSGGGILDLIQCVLKCSRQDALKWLADFTCTTLQDTAFTDGERLDYARRKAQAAAEARDLLAWRDRLIEALQGARDSYFQAYHRTRRVIQRRGLVSPEGQLAADMYESYEARYQELDRSLDRLRHAPMATLLPFYRTRNLWRAAA